MEPDNLNLNLTTLFANGQEIGKVENLNLKNEQPQNDVKLNLNKSFECSFKMKKGSAKRLSKIFKLHSENKKLIRIRERTRKPRVKEKLLGRINRNTYKLMSL